MTAATRAHDPTPARRRGVCIFVCAAWIAFVVSLMLPAARFVHAGRALVLPGWYCALHYAPAWGANLLAAAAPAAALITSLSLRRAWALLLLASASLAGLLPALHRTLEWHAGYYAWLAALAVMGITLAVIGRGGREQTA